jgi:hypothetical protein
MWKIHMDAEAHILSTSEEALRGYNVW